MSPFSSFPTIPSLRPMYNIGGMFDIPTGTYHLGKYGQSVCNGGVPIIFSIVGPGNSFKTAEILFANLSIADKIEQFHLGIYDNEISLTYERVNVLCKRFPNISLIKHGDEYLPPEQMRIKITSSAEMLGDVYWGMIEDLVEVKKKSREKLLTTPFFNQKLEPFLSKPPTGVIIDSISKFQITNLQTNIVEKTNVGDSAAQTLWLREGGAKKQLITRLPNLCAQGALCVSMTAHVGAEFVMDQMAPKKHKLAFAKRGTEIKGASPEFKMLNNALWEIFDASPLNNKERGTGVLYPLLECDRHEDCTDLMKVHLKLTRNKSGPTGASVTHVVSQREGVLEHLSMFHFIKVSDDYGLVGNNTTYCLNLLPEVKLSRTTVRGIIDSNFKVRRALEITSDLLQYQLYYQDRSLLCTPEELYNGIINLGYNWDTLFNTRNHWVFEESENNNLPFLSTWDLLRMRAGLYTPYFLQKQYHKNFKGRLKEIVSAIPEAEYKT